MSLLINCHESTRLSVLRDEKGLSLLDKLKLFIHFKLCIVCKYFDQQIHKINGMLSELSQPIDQTMTDDQKQALIQNILQKIKK